MLSGNLEITPEALQIGFIFGIVVSLIMYERFHITGGSILMPTNIGLGILDPPLLLLTVTNAFIVYWLVHRLLPRVMIMEGRTKFLAAISVSAALQFIMLSVGISTEMFAVSASIGAAIGFVMPGLIAHDMRRHGIGQTVVIVAAGGMLLAVVLVAISLLLPTGSAQVAPLSPAFIAEPRWLGLAMLLSIIGAIAVRNGYGFRAGGFVGSAYLSVLVANPADLIFIFAVSALVYLVVKQAMRNPQLILFGRRKFAAVMMISVVVAQGLLLLIEGGIGYGGLTVAAFPLAAIFVPGLFANDAERSGVLRVLIGTGLVMAFATVNTLLIAELDGQRRVFVLVTAAPAALVTAMIVFRVYPSRMFQITKATQLARLASTSLRTFPLLP